MDLSNPISSVIPNGHGAVLTVLARTDRGLSGRGIAELTAGQLAKSRVQEILGELVRAGIVAAEDHPPAKLYRLNRTHVAATAIVALADLRGELIHRIRGAIDSWEPQPESAWLFGSAARGEGDAESDVDVLIVRADPVAEDAPAWAEQLVALSGSIREWSGNDASVIEYSASEFAVMVAAGERLIDDIRRDGIHLAGDPRIARLRVGSA